MLYGFSFDIFFRPCRFYCCFYRDWVVIDYFLLRRTKRLQLNKGFSYFKEPLSFFYFFFFFFLQFSNIFFFFNSFFLTVGQNVNRRWPSAPRVGVHFQRRLVFIFPVFVEIVCVVTFDMFAHEFLLFQFRWQVIYDEFKAASVSR